MHDHTKYSARSRRSFLKKAFASMALGATGTLAFPASVSAHSQDPGKFRITKLETFKVKPRWLFLKVHTDQGIVGLGEPVVEGRADTVATAVKEIEPYLLGKGSPAGDPSLAGHLPACLLSRRARTDQRPERGGAGPVGHQGEGPGCSHI